MNPTMTLPLAHDLRFAPGDLPAFSAGDHVRVLTRLPLGHYRVPHYIRGKAAIVEAIMTPPTVDNEEEGFGRNAGGRLRYYRIAIPLRELWANYQGSPSDGLGIEVYETWLKGVADES